MAAAIVAKSAMFLWILVEVLGKFRINYSQRQLQMTAKIQMIDRVKEFSFELYKYW